MDDRMSELNTTLERLERLLLRLEVDIATGLFGVDYQATIAFSARGDEESAELAQESKRGKAELTSEPSMPDGMREADDPAPSQGFSKTHCVSFTRGRSAGTSSRQRRES